jgi:hypothetical protein
MNRLSDNQLIKIFVLLFVIVLCGCGGEQNKKDQATQHDIEEGQLDHVQQEKNIPLKNEEFTWFFEMCDYEGTYVAGKYTTKQLENTLQYLVSGEGTSQPFSIFSPDDLKRVNRVEVERKFDKTLKSLKTLEFVNTPYFNEIKQKRIAEIERLKLLSLIQIDSYSKPKVLLSDDYSKVQCDEYTNALIAGGDELLSMRKKMAEQSRDEGNSLAMSRFIEETQSGEQLEFARVFVSTFGWWNCVNYSIERVETWEAHKRFIQLFDEITEECEEP